MNQESSPFFQENLTEEEETNFHINNGSNQILDNTSFTSERIVIEDE
jgi:hypothetical protein